MISVTLNENIPLVLKLLINFMSVEQKQDKGKSWFIGILIIVHFCAKLKLFASLELTFNGYQEKLTQSNKDYCKYSGTAVISLSFDIRGTATTLPVLQHQMWWESLLASSARCQNKGMWWRKCNLCPLDIKKYVLLHYVEPLSSDLLQVHCINFVIKTHCFANWFDQYILGLYKKCLHVQYPSTFLAAFLNNLVFYLYILRIVFWKGRRKK